MAGEKWRIHRVEMDISGLTDAISSRSSPKIRTSGRMRGEALDPSVFLIMKSAEKIQLSPEQILCQDTAFSWWVKSQNCSVSIDAPTLKQTQKVIIDYGEE